VKLKNVVEVAQFDRATIEEIFALADKMRDLPRAAAPLTGSILATIFYEPSTRTRLSFECAMLRIGGQFISTDNAR
jgi:aspartate carbamoyltransferase catalytic subunit